MTGREPRWTRLETINMVSTVVMALCAVAMLTSTWRSYNLAEKALQANEEPLVEVQDVQRADDGITYTLKNSGTIRLENVKVNERALEEGILDRAISVLEPFYADSAQEIQSLKPGESIALSSKWISLKNIASPRINDGSSVRIVELRISFAHQVSKRTYEKIFQFFCFPSNAGWRFHHRTEFGMETLRTVFGQSIRKK